jgi:hypothetical protein
MPLEDLPEMNLKLKKNISKNANAYVYEVEQRMINEMMNEVNNDYKRTMNEIILRNLIEEGYEFPISNIINK